MPDVFIEHIVKKQRTLQGTLLKALIAFGAVFIAILVLTFASLLGPFSIFATVAAVGAVVGAYYLITSMNVEFEYAVTNGELDVDKIVAQRKRKRLITVKCREVEAFGRYKESEHAGKTYQAKIFACDNPKSEDLWYCVSRQKEKGLTLLVFNGNEKVLGGIKPFLPGPIMHSAFRIGG